MTSGDTPRLYFILDEPTLDCGRFLETMRQAIEGGVCAIQYRSKEPSTRHVLAVAEPLVHEARRRRVSFVMNDRVDVALALGADGVHVGEDDMPVELARRMVGPASLVGASVRTPDEARRAVDEGASYVAVGAVFPSPSKPDAPVVGLEAVARVRAAVRVPVCAIGGISLENVAEVVTAGADLICVIAAIGQAPDPRQAAADLLAAMAAARQKAP